ncbi:hypothetical protein ACQCSX_04375 [Pseudarthrobacter sp. P1]|uniref:hypothetical protein n=1 Tax=Pseudarthrobacter sp. P1 TaxID=3418418 RepID=UPI003CE6BCD6
MANKELKKLFKELEAQEFRIEEIKSGWQVYPPNTTLDPITIHGTPSDHRSWKNMMARLVRAGFIR